MRASRVSLALAAGVMLIACSAQREAGMLPGAASQPPQPDSAQRGHASLTLSVRIPRHGRSHYVSANTQSLVVVEESRALGTFNTTPSSAGCGALDGSTLCRFTMGVVPGKHRLFTVTAYDATGGAGSVLSSGSVVQNVKVGINVIAVTLSGVVHAISVALQNPNPAAGTATNGAVIVTALDADGNVIIGPGNYNVSISLVDSDTSGITALSSASVTGPGNRVSFAYDGRSITRATISASASGIATATAAFAPTPTVIGNFTVPSGAAGASQASEAVTSGPGGNVWFSVCCSTYGLVQMTPAGAMTYYAGGTGGLPTGTAFTGLAPGADGKLYYVGGAHFGSVTTAGAATDFPVGLAVCAGSTNGTAARIVADPRGTAAKPLFWMTIVCGSNPSVLLDVQPASSGYAASINTLTGVEAANGLVVGHDGNIYVAGEDIATGQATVAQGVPKAGSGPVNLSSVLRVDVVGTVSVAARGIVQTADGDLWAEIPGASPLARVHLSPTFAASPVSTFEMISGIPTASFATALPDGSFWVPEGNYATVERVTPGAYPSAPALYDLSLPSNPSILGLMYDSTIDVNGDLWVTDRSVGGGGSAPNTIVKVAY